MAAIYRYGFEGGYVPNGVSFSGSYQVVNGRSASGSAVMGRGISQSYVVMESKEFDNSVFVSYQLNLTSSLSGNKTTLFQFGPTKITYTPNNSTFELSSNGILLTSSISTIDTGKFLPYTIQSFIDSTMGNLQIASVNTGMTINYQGNTIQGSTDVYPNKIYLGLGSTSQTAQLVVDDVAVNNSLSYSNSSGSYGLSDNSTPPLIKATRTLITTTGSISQWKPLYPVISNDVVAIVNGVVDSFIQATQYDKLTQFLIGSVDPNNIKSVEGINVYIDDATISSVPDNVFLNGYFQLPGAVSINAAASTQLTIDGVYAKYSALEKDSGGKISISDFNSASVCITPKQFINKNYFGNGIVGNQIYTGSVLVGGSSDGFEFLDFDNLTIASGATVTTSTKKRGLIIYVKENCIIEGTLSMNGMGHSGSINDSSSVVWKNISASFIVESSSLASDSTWTNEQLYQPYTNGISTQFGISTYTLPGVNGLFGGGGSGGGAYASGGLGSTSSYWSGGTGGGGAAVNSTGRNAGDYALNGGLGGISSSISGGLGAANPGGSIYLFVGKNLILGSTGIITATGSNGLNGSNSPTPPNNTGGGGGAGGGNVNIFYGFNYYNLGGSIHVEGGLGGTGFNGGTNGSNGGSGSYQIVKLLTN